MNIVLGPVYMSVYDAVLTSGGPLISGTDPGLRDV